MSEKWQRKEILGYIKIENVQICENAKAFGPIDNYDSAILPMLCTVNHRLYT